MQIKNQSQKESGKPKLLDQVKNHLRTLHYSRRTEESYINWIKRFIIFRINRIIITTNEIKYDRDEYEIINKNISNNVHIYT